MNDLDQKIFHRLVDRYNYPSHIAKDIVERGPVLDHHLNDYLQAKHASLHELARERVERENVEGLAIIRRT